jgi:translation initiation factor IF-1
MEEHIQIEGRILTVLAGTMFRVELDNKHQVLATISGKMRKRFVRLTIGDRVKMEMSQYDLNKARIVWRLGWRTISLKPRLRRTRTICNLQRCEQRHPRRRRQRHPHGGQRR